MRYVLKNNYELTAPEKNAIRQLLAFCFSDYPKDRMHLKQCPSFRLLAYDGPQLIGHIAVDHRQMNNSDQLIEVFGLSDVCVLSNYRSQKVATQMIKKISELAQKQAIDFLILIAWDVEVYLSMGFQQVDNTCRWLILHKDRSLGLAQRSIPDGLMIKALGTQKWEQGLVDFMGPIF